MPWYRPNGELGGFYSKDDLQKYRSRPFNFAILLILSVIAFLFFFGPHFDWTNVGQVTTLITVVLAGVGVLASIIFSAVLGALNISSYGGAAEWTGYGFRMLGLLFIISAFIGALGSFSETPDFLIGFGVIGFFGTVAWVVIGGIVGAFYMGGKAFLPLVLGVIGFFTVALLVGQGGNFVAVALSVPVIAGTVLQLAYDVALD